MHRVRQKNAGRRELLVFMFHENKKTVWLNVTFSQS